MRISTDRIKEETQGFCDIINITPKVQDRVEKEKFQQGLVSLFVSGSTAALTTIEYEPGLIQDLKDFLEKMIPSNKKYHHDDRWGDNNGFSHVRASLLGPSLQVPMVAGKLQLGTWQQIVLLDFDNRPRQREILIQMMGETA
jgi:secondary thiamine-phosphate synthase enzyme